MEGKLFYGDAALPTAAENTDFIFDLQRFDRTDGLTDSAENGWENSDNSRFLEVRLGGESSSEVLYFDSMQNALNYIQTQQNKTAAITSTTTNAYIKLLNDVASGDGFKGNNVSDLTYNNGTRVVIDLNNHTYTFAKSLETSVTKRKGVQLLRTSKDNDVSYFEFKNGTLNVATADKLTGKTFERLIRSYVDVTFDSVVIDGTNVTEQVADAHGAVVCHSAGTLTLKGATSIYTQDDSGSGPKYYALTEELSNDGGGNYSYGLAVVVNISGTDSNGNEANIKNIGIRNGYDSVFDSAKYTAAALKPSLSIQGTSIVGEITLSDLTNKGNDTTTVVTGEMLQNGISVATTANVGNFDASKVTATNGLKIYAQSLAADANYALALGGWNKDITTTSTQADKWNFVAARTATDDNRATGQVVVSVSGGVDSSADLAYDSTNKVFGVPSSSTVGWGTGVTNGKVGDDQYYVAKLNYKNANKTEVTVAVDAEGVDNPNVVLNAAGSGVIANTAQKIDARGNTVALSIIGNTLNNTIYGGDSNNTFTGGAGKDAFVYNGKGSDVITDYTVTQGDYVILDGVDPVTLGTGISTPGNNLILTFGDKSLTFTGLANEGITNNTIVPGGGISVQSGNKTYRYTKASITESDALTLTGGYATASYVASDSGNFATINAADVGKAFTLHGGTGNNYLVGSASGGELWGQGGNDVLVGAIGVKDVFRYTAGRDVIDNYEVGRDVANIVADNITDAKVNAKDQLIFTTSNKDNTITFNAVADSVVSAVSLDGGGLLTRAGKVDATGAALTLFAGAKGKIDGASYTNIDASKVTSNVVTIEGGASGGTFTFANNKKADVFEYGGGAAVVAGYVADSDKINLGDYTYETFTVNGDNVVLNTKHGNTNGTVSIGNVKGKEVLLHDGDRNKTNQYSKLVFADNGVLQDKASKPTSVTISGGASSYDAGNTVKKIAVNGEFSKAISISGGNVNAAIDLSDASLNVADNANAAMSIIGGTKNDKITAGAAKEVFVYKGGKDVITGYGSADSMSLDGFSMSDITKTTKSGNTITLKFKKSSDSLTIKGDSSSMNTIAIGGASYAFGKKNTIYVGGVASLTSGFSGTYTADTATTDASSATKNLTIKGLKNSDDTITAGKGSKTMLKGQGGNDNLVGGSGVDTFYYKKGEKGDIKITNFDGGTDKIKISGSKVITNIDTTDSKLTFTMDGASIKIDTYGQDGTESVGMDKIAIRANNTCYWFDSDGFTDISGESHASGWVTSINKITASKAKSEGFTVVDLGYSTNLVKAGLAYKVNDNFPPVATNNN